MFDEHCIWCIHSKNESIRLISGPSLENLNLFLVNHSSNLQYTLVKRLQLSHQSLFFVHQVTYFVLVRSDLRIQRFENFIFHFKLDIKDFLVVFFVGYEEHLFSVGLDFSNCQFERVYFGLDNFSLLMNSNLCLLYFSQVLKHQSIGLV